MKIRKSLPQRGLPQLGLAICGLLFLASFGAPCHAASAKKPNFIILMSDDQGYGDVGIHGNSLIETPNLDRFAAEGTELTRFYTSPVCAPTRASLMTGRYYYRSGVIHTSRGGAKMHGDEVTLAEILSAAGYRTGIFGKWHLGDTYPMRPQDQGFFESLIHLSGGIDQAPDKPNSYFDPLLHHNGRPFKSQGYCTDVFFDAAIQFIESCGSDPFFVYLPTNAPHTPLEVSSEYRDPYKAKGLDDTTARVYGMVQNIDENLGRLLARLDELGIRNDTVLVFFGDNGPQQQRYNAGLRGRKSWIYEGGIRAACFVQWPGHILAGQKIDRVAAHVDIAPTFVDLAAAAVPDGLKFDGVSLAPLLLNQKVDWPDRTLYFQCHRGLEPQRYQNAAAVGQRFKMVSYPGTFNNEDLDTTGDPVLELYDLESDPGEERNLAGQSPDVLAALRKGYDVWFNDVKETRHFAPGVIHLGSPHENPVRLCRYQDATFRDGEPHGWLVEVEREGPYRFVVNRGQSDAPGRVFADWNGRRQSHKLAAGENSAVFELTAGRGTIDVWITENGKPRAVVSDNSTLGDVVVERLD